MIRDYRNIAITGDMDDMIQFSQARERIRIKKEANEPWPWSNDWILNESKFCNIFREDDKVSKHIFEKVNSLQGKDLFAHLFVYRFFNRIDHIDTLGTLTDPVAQVNALVDDNEKTSIMNSKAYQFYPTEVGRQWGCRSIREVARERLPQGIDRVWEAFEKNLSTSFKELVYAMSEAWGRGGHFWFLQIALDYAWLTNDTHLLRSEVYAGDGGKSIYKLFNMTAEELTPIVNELWHDKKRELYPFDIEQLTCEYRKYKLRVQENKIPNNRKYNYETSL